MLIGMLHHRSDPTKVIKSYAYAAVAMAEGAQLLFFSPKMVDLENKVINGYIYEKGEWKKVPSKFPDVIYNAGSPEKSASEVIDKLRNIIPFTTNAIGNKMRVYERLKQYDEFTNYLIPTEIVSSVKQFLKFLKTHRKVILKPVNGHKGQGVIYINEKKDKINMLIGTDEQVVTLDELCEIIKERIKNEQYLVQPYINCKTKLGVAYDIRLHVQKNENGNWVLTSAYPRFAKTGSIVSNINSGGSTNYLTPFLETEFKDEYYNIKKYLEVFAIQLAMHMDKIQMDCFNEKIDELGIDVGLDSNRKIWIYEINWRPGCPPTFYLELDVVKNMIRYAMFLANENNKVNEEVKESLRG